MDNGGAIPSGKILGVFTQAQHDALVQICSVNSSEDHERLLDILLEMRHFLEIGPVLDEFSAFSAHRENLREAANSAAKLSSCLQNEPLLDHMLASELTEGYDIKSAVGMVNPILRAIDAIATSARSITEDPELLHSLRLGKDDSSKSLERRFIWEPFLAYWSKTGKRVGYSDDGPIMRVFRLVHEAFGIDAPHADTIRQVVRDHQKGGVLRLVK